MIQITSRRDVRTDDFLLLLVEVDGHIQSIVLL